MYTIKNIRQSESDNGRNDNSEDDVHNCKFLSCENTESDSLKYCQLVKIRCIQVFICQFLNFSGLNGFYYLNAPVKIFFCETIEHQTFPSPRHLEWTIQISQQGSNHVVF